MKKRSLWTALVLSVAIHAGVAVGLWSLAPRKKASRADIAKPLDVQIVRLPALPSPAAPSAASSPALAASGSQVSQKANRSPSARANTAEVGIPSRGGQSSQSDVPKAIALTPRSSAVLGTAPQESSRGALIQNNGGSSVNPAIQREVDAERAGRRLQAWVEDDLAEVRVASGLVDSSYYRMKDKLQEALPLVPLNKGLEQALKSMVDSYLAGLETYGRTGNPFTRFEPSSQLSALSGTPMQKALKERTQGSGDLSNHYRQVTENHLLDIGQGKLSRRWLAEVEVQQNTDGTLRSALLVRSSGDGSFDRRALDAVPFAVAELTPGALTGKGRSLWAFEGRITFMKKLKHMNRLEDALYLAVMSWAAISGSFDLTNLSETEIPDFREPRLKTNVKLLKVY